MTANREMPRYRCHKKVRALKIENYEIYEEGGGAVYPADRSYAPFEVGAAWASRFKPVGTDLGYYVVYDDGYTSWSPTEAFEEGYSRDDGMDFGDAVRAMKNGQRVARSGWNGKGMWLSLSGPNGPREIAYENFWSKHNSEYARLNGGSASVLPCITMKTATGEILMGWLASQTDMLAEDWAVVE